MGIRQTMSRLHTVSRSPQEDVARLIDDYPLQQLHGQHLFITGGTGFIGFWLLTGLAELNRRGANIRVTALSRTPERFLSRFPQFFEGTWLKIIQGDVCTYKFPHGAIDGVIHGALDSALIQRPIEALQASMFGTHRVLEHALAAGVWRFQLISSGTVYGEQPPGLDMLPETATIGPDLSNPFQLKGEAKRAAEAMVSCYRQEYGIETLISRCFTTYGFGLPRNLAFSQFILDAMTNEKITVTGDGKPVRGYLYAADLAIWLLAIQARGTPGITYNVGSDQALSIAETARAVARMFAPKKMVDVLSSTPTLWQWRYLPDITRICNELGVALWTDLPSGIAAMARDCNLAAPR